MANIDIITLRSAVTTQALATMGSDPEWDRKLAAYLRAEALQQSDYEFGAYAVAQNEVGLDEIRIEAQHGRGWHARPEHAPVYRSQRERLEAASDEWQRCYADPHDTTARELAMTPAPTLAAALFKQLVIFREDLGNDNRMPRDAMEIVAEDMARLAEEAGVPV